MRFELFFAARYLKAKRRQAVVGVVTVISIAGVAAGVAALIIALAITSQPQRVNLPLALKLESAKLPKPSWVKISQVRTLSTERLGKRLGRLSAEEIDQVIEGLFELVA